MRNKASVEKTSLLENLSTAFLSLVIKNNQSRNFGINLWNPLKTILRKTIGIEFSNKKFIFLI
ncbi:MAG: hypothetical protein LBP67_08965 [Bacteroidales bacterium]|nr:hypothetical protein [Bacteroidales bacterium]